MRQRLILLSIGLLSLGWILFSAYDVLSNENLTDFRHYFTPKDRTVFVVQDPNSLDWNNERIVTTELNQSLYFSFRKQLKEPSIIFFSSKHTKMLIEKKTNWTATEVKALFQNGLFPFQMGRLKKFTFGKLHGLFNGNQLLVYDGELPVAQQNKIQVSAKASFAWFSWEQNQIKLTETYRKKEGYYRYIKTNNRNPQLSKKDDQALFSEVVPDFFNTYYFYDKTYAVQLDPKFANSPWLKCMKSGFVHLKKDSSSLVIFDFNENANPIQTLNEYFHKPELNTETASFDRLHFSKLIDPNKNTWHVAVFGQFGLASPDKALLDQALAAANLGQTLAQDERLTKRFFANMPRKVSTRWVDPGQKQTVTLLGKQIVQTNYYKQSATINEESDKIRDYFVMNPGYRILHFATFDQRGNAIVFTENHQLVGYINGLRKWDKPVQQDVKGLYQIKAFPQLICVQFANEAQLFDKTGRIVYRLSHQAGTAIQVVDNKGKKEFICVNDANSVLLYNENGGLIKQFNVGQTPKQLLSYKSAGKPFVSILTDNQYHLIDVAKRRSQIKQTVDSTYVLVANQGGAFAVKVSKSKATVLSSNGQKQFGVPNAVECIGSYLQGNNQMLLFKNNTALYAYSLDGQRAWEKTINAVEISQFTTYLTNDQRQILALLDAIGNQIYLLDDLGRDLDTQKRHGQQEIQLSAFGNNAYSLTTYLGTYLIQYNRQ